jgi:dienelactone hydrolase
MSKRVTFQTSDGVTIVGDYYSGPKGGPTALLLHMRPAVRDSWELFATKLVEAGFSALAIDLRGHGESINTKDGRVLDYNKFSQEEEQESLKDLEAAVVWLKENHGLTDEKLVLAGASIGGNFALQYFAESPQSPATILLSAGVNYHGVLTLPSAQKLQPTQAVYVVAAKDDVRSGGAADSMAQEIHDAVEGKKALKIFDTGGHGTDIFKAHPECMDELITWLSMYTQ